MKIVEPIKNFFKPKRKNKRKPLSKLSIFILIVFGIAALNFAQLYPDQISYLFYMVEIKIIQFLFNDITLQFWFWSVLTVVTGFLIYHIRPRLRVPSIAEKGKTYHIRRKWVEGDIQWFRTILGYEIGIHKDVVVNRNFSLAYDVIDKVEKAQSGNTILLQTENMEVSRSVHDKKRVQMLMEENAKLYEILENQGITYTKEEIKEQAGKVVYDGKD